MVSISKYPCFCSANVTTFTSKKDGRGFLKCRRETSTLFVQEEQYKTLMEAYDSQVDARFKPNNFQFELQLLRKRIGVFLSSGQARKYVSTDQWKSFTSLLICQHHKGCVLSAICHLVLSPH